MLTKHLVVARELERVDILAVLGELPAWKNARMHRAPQGTPALAPGGLAVIRPAAA
jgi:hypothetical protein